MYGGLSTTRESLEDMNLFDLQRQIWIPIAQTGFVPSCEGRYNFAMSYDQIGNKLVIFGG